MIKYPQSHCVATVGVIQGGCRPYEVGSCYREVGNRGLALKVLPGSQSITCSLLLFHHKTKRFFHYILLWEEPSNHRTNTVRVSKVNPTKFMLLTPAFDLSNDRTNNNCLKLVDKPSQEVVHSLYKKNYRQILSPNLRNKLMVKAITLTQL